MDSDLVSRRHFLLTSSAAALAPLLTRPSTRALITVYRQATSASPPAGFFAPEQLAVIEAASNRIFPAVDGMPNAAAMQAPQFIDQVVQQVFVEAQKPYVEGIKAIESATKKLHPRAKGFASLDEEQQDAVLATIEKTPFFGMLSAHTR